MFAYWVLYKNLITHQFKLNIVNKHYQESKHHESKHNPVSI